MPTTGFQAGVEANDVEVSFGKETVWNTKPAVAFQAVRYMSESFGGSKTRARPGEVRTDYQASAATTTQEAATGGINFALSYGTYDDLLAGLFNADWTTTLAISGTDIAGTATGYSSATAGKFSTIRAGQWIKVAGFSNSANNGFKRVTAATGTTVTTAQSGAVEAAGPSVTMKGSSLQNSTVFQSFHFQKKLSSAMYLIYPGSYCTGGTISASTGQFMQGSLTFLPSVETKQTTNQSTGAVLAAPTGNVNDTIAGFNPIEVNGTTIAATVDAISVQIAKDGAGAQYGLGSATAAGLTRGTLTVTGSVRMFFRDFTYYDLYKAETQVNLSYRSVDPTGVGYQLTIPAATLLNPTIVAGGPGQPVVAEFQIEGAPHATLGYTISLDKLPL
jgi:hypothetical protein